MLYSNLVLLFSFRQSNLQFILKHGSRNKLFKLGTSYQLHVAITCYILLKTPFTFTSWHLRTKTRKDFVSATIKSMGVFCLFVCFKPFFFLLLKIWRKTKNYMSCFLNSLVTRNVRVSTFKRRQRYFMANPRMSTIR